jgi:putative transposase
VVAQTLSQRDTKKEKKVKVKHLYQVFGISKQAYHKRIEVRNTKEEQEQKILHLVADIRKIHPRAGTRKLMIYLQPQLQEMNLKIGRDALFTLLRKHDLLIEKTKLYHITTDSKHGFYKSPNLLKDKEITHSEQAFVADITYIKTDQGHAYLAIVTDVYSKKIMGYAIEDNMRVELVQKALKMAYKNCIFKHQSIIHHSDRGIQYCCPAYSHLAKQLGFIQSTTQQYDPYENAVAERINGILKYEYGLRYTLPNLTIAKQMVAQAVSIYNTQRVHWSLGFKTPEAVHQQYNPQQYKSYAKQKVCA